MKETAKDPVLSTVMRYAREGWPQGPSNGTTNSEDSHIQTVQLLKKLKDSVSYKRMSFLRIKIGHSSKSTPSSSGDSTPGTFWNSTHEAVSTYSCVLAWGRRGHCSDEPRLFAMRGAPEQTDQSTHSPVDGAGETLEPNSCGSCHKFHGFELVSRRGRLLQVSVCSPHDLYLLQGNHGFAGAGFWHFGYPHTIVIPAMPLLLPPRNFKSGVDAEELRTSREHHTTLKPTEQRNGWFNP